MSFANHSLVETNPSISFSEIIYDFGEVQQGVKLEHVFTFINSGEGKLTIQDVKPSCGCTGAAMGDKKEFESGETGEIKITFNTEGRSGIIEKTINVTTNDPANPQVTLKFKCSIQENKQ